MMLRSIAIVLILLLSAESIAEEKHLVIANCSLDDLSNVRHNILGYSPGNGYLLYVSEREISLIRGNCDIEEITERQMGEEVARIVKVPPGVIPDKFSGEIRQINAYFTREIPRGAYWAEEIPKVEFMLTTGEPIVYDEGSGTGVKVLVYDEGIPENLDFIVALLDPEDKPSEHTTIMASTIASDLMGIPSCQLYIDGIDLEEIEKEYNRAISEGVKIAVNPWGLVWPEDPCRLGIYEVFSEYFDYLVYANDLVIVLPTGNRGETCGKFGTLTAPSTAKNVITVGSVDESMGLSRFSGIGPTADGRLKPELVAPGEETLTSEAEGTSMAAAYLTGSIAMILEKLEEIGIDPSPALVKALLIQGAKDLTSNPFGNPLVGPDYLYGYGFPSLENSLKYLSAQNIYSGEISDGEEIHLYFYVGEGDDEVKLTLAYDDYPLVYYDSPKTLVNDLDIYLVSPSGKIHQEWVLDPKNPSSPASFGDNDLDNLKQVRVLDPEPGIWEVVVYAEEVNFPEKQEFFIVSSHYLSKYPGVFHLELPDYFLVLPKGEEVKVPVEIGNLGMPPVNVSVVLETPLAFSLTNQPGEIAEGETLEYFIFLRGDNVGEYPVKISLVESESGRLILSEEFKVLVSESELFIIPSPVIIGERGSFRVLNNGNVPVEDLLVKVEFPGRVTVIPGIIDRLNPGESASVFVSTSSPGEGRVKLSSNGEILAEAPLISVWQQRNVSNRGNRNSEEESGHWDADKRENLVMEINLPRETRENTCCQIEVRVNHWSGDTRRANLWVEHSSGLDVIVPSVVDLIPGESSVVRGTVCPRSPGIHWIRINVDTGRWNWVEEGTIYVYPKREENEYGSPINYNNNTPKPVEEEKRSIEKTSNNVVKEDVIDTENDEEEESESHYTSERTSDEIEFKREYNGSMELKEEDSNASKKSRESRISPLLFLLPPLALLIIVMVFTEEEKRRRRRLLKKRRRTRHANTKLLRKFTRRAHQYP